MIASTTYIEIALVIFMTVFVGIVIWTFLVRRSHHDEAARIPLSDDPVTPRNGNASNGSQS